MSDVSRSTLCPVLVADLADRSARDYLAGVALANGIAVLPLLAPPVDSAAHQLEVYTPGSAEPLVLHAEPAGAPSERGFPLRLRARGAVSTSKTPTPTTLPEMPGSTTLTPSKGTPAVAAPLAPRRKTKVTMSERHTRDLSGLAPARAPESLVGHALANGKLQVESVIGTGGAGAVFKAMHRELRMPVAVKILRESFQNDIEFCRRFHAEALAASRLDHLNIVRVLDYGQEPDGMLYLAMEYLEGTPLARLIEREGAMPVRRIVEIMAQVCAGLAHAHQRDIVHRDVKPDNIVLVCVRDDDDRALERVKVCDFGIAVEKHDEDGAMVIAGTPAYMSPEQCRGEPLDGRSDVYACGIVLYELATGQVPFTGDDVIAIVNRHMYVPPAKPSLVNPEIDPRLEAIIMRALAKDARDRQASMRELRAELRALVDADVDSDRTPPAMPGPDVAPPVSAKVRRESVRAISAVSDQLPDWLETGSNIYACVPSDGTPTPTPVGAKTPVPVPPSPELSAKLGAWLAELADTPSYAGFATMAKQLEDALPALVARRDIRALIAVHSTLEMIRSTAARATMGAQRSTRVRGLLGAFADPALLLHLAEVALVDDDREAARLLVNLGTPAAYALYSTRLKNPGDATIRRRFVGVIHTMSVTALPMIRAGLAKLAPHHERSVARELAIDLLLATPNLRDDDAGELAARWARVGPVEVTRAAVPALAKLWGERARPMFVAALASKDVLLANAAFAALDAIGGSDEDVTARVRAVAHAG